MKKQSLFIIIIGSMFLVACKKVSIMQPQTCIQLQTIPQNLYDSRLDLFTGSIYNDPICGILPLHKNNYWVYRDSCFHYQTGAFLSVRIDTLRFKEGYMYADSIRWWKTVVPIGPGYGYYKGYYDRVYSTDSILYTLTEGSVIKKSNKWFLILNADSVYTGVSWNDTNYMDAYGKKEASPVVVPAGTFNGCGLFIKKYGFAYVYNQDIYFKPGIGVVKSYQYYHNGFLVPSDVLTIKSELLSYHLE